MNKDREIVTTWLKQLYETVHILQPEFASALAFSHHQEVATIALSLTNMLLNMRDVKPQVREGFHSQVDASAPLLDDGNVQVHWADVNRHPKDILDDVTPETFSLHAYRAVPTVQRTDVEDQLPIADEDDDA